ncbi:MAG: hypothetical protein JWO89_1912 [Verrucomicrobiaceae bacterium]|nr:hypothetical protein [Verrucomicrobiaceae bacterium]
MATIFSRRWFKLEGRHSTDDRLSSNVRELAGNGSTLALLGVAGGTVLLVLMAQEGGATPVIATPPAPVQELNRKPPAASVAWIFSESDGRPAMGIKAAALPRSSTFAMKGIALPWSVSLPEMVPEVLTVAYSGGGRA